LPAEVPTRRHGESLEAKNGFWVFPSPEAHDQMFCLKLHGRLVNKVLPERPALADSVQVSPQLRETRILASDTAP
jgi:hypothetical protein